MAYKITKTKEESKQQLEVLVGAFAKEYAIYKTSKYSEAQLRIDFINPLLKTFGWDVDNEDARSQFLREVLQEEPIDVEENELLKKKNPDYTLRIEGSRKLFVEAKKVSIDIEKSSQSAFQIRRYGWNGNLGISILTNFDKLIIYDCRYKPNASDDSSIAKYQVFTHSNFLKEFEKLYNLLSIQSVASGYIDEYFSLTQNNLSTFDDYFLSQIEKWRFQLATDIIQNNSGFSEEELNFLIQRLLNRIIFLRICEDREIEKYETLKAIKNYNELKEIFIVSDKKYNSGLFDFIEDHFSLNINLKSEILVGIFNELYYPESPYNFAIVDPAILSQIYERYLGSKIIIKGPTEILIVEEPEIAVSSGVVPTPKRIVQNIIRETLEPLLKSKTSSDIKLLKIADICCGSGTFLISLYDFLVEKIVLAFIAEGINDDEIIYKKFDGTYHLTLKTKQEFLLQNIYGVDVNPYAVEVTKFSLFLKLLENENEASLNNFLIKYSQKVLPILDNNIKNGNSLIDEKYFEFNPTALENNDLLFKIRPFNWKNEFSFLQESNGFDAIIGNPPYVRIQNMVKYMAEGINYYKDKRFGYNVAKADSFDKYYLFIERAISLIKPTGILAYIVPNKFFIAKGGKALRTLLATSASVDKIIHFGVSQVFPNRSTYTAIIIVDKIPRENIKFTRIKNIQNELKAGSLNYIEYSKTFFSENPWIFLSKNTRAIFDRINYSNTIKLNTIANITVGLQTSKDEVYIFNSHSETDTTFKFTKNNNEYEVEKEICKPCLLDLSFDQFDTIEPNAQMIFPYILTSEKAQVFEEIYFQEKYPLAWKYLNTFKDILCKRSINGSKEPKWYQFGRSQSLTKFHNIGKLVWPVLSTHSNYIFDSNNLQFTGGGNGPYYSLISSKEYSPLYFLAILSHPLFEAMVKSGASEFRGAYYSHGKQFIENIPIKKIDFSDPLDKKEHDNIVAIVESIIATKELYNKTSINSNKNILQRKLSMLQKNLNHAVSTIYKIEEEDINTVLTDEIFTTDLNEI